MPLKPPSRPGAQSAFCSKRCAWRFKQRRHRGGQRNPRLRLLTDEEIAAMPQSTLAEYGVRIDP